MTDGRRVPGLRWIIYIYICVCVCRVGGSVAPAAEKFWERSIQAPANLKLWVCVCACANDVNTEEEEGGCLVAGWLDQVICHVPEQFGSPGIYYRIDRKPRLYFLGVSASLWPCCCFCYYSLVPFGWEDLIRSRLCQPHFRRLYVTYPLVVAAVVGGWMTIEGGGSTIRQSMPVDGGEGEKVTGTSPGSSSQRERNYLYEHGLCLGNGARQSDAREHSMKYQKVDDHNTIPAVFATFVPDGEEKNNTDLLILIKKLSFGFRFLRLLRV